MQTIMKNKVKDFIQQNKRVSFDEICVFLGINTVETQYKNEVRQLDAVLRDLIIEDFIVFYNGKYCLRKKEK